MTIAHGSTIGLASGLPGQVTWSAPATDAEPGDTVDARAAGRSLAYEAAAARRALREAASTAAEAAARALSLAEMLDELLLALTTQEHAPALAPTSSTISAPETDALSRREREVLALVAEGYTNKAIAKALYISPNTVKTHVASLLSKLQVESRVQLAAMATTSGLLPVGATNSGL